MHPTRILLDHKEKWNMPKRKATKSARSRRHGKIRRAAQGREEETAATTTTADNLVDPKHLLCPITHKILFDPVMASDGHVYERWAIEMHIKTSKNKSGGNVCSPITRKSMESNVEHLKPVHPVKNLVEELVHKKLIGKEAIDDWMNQKKGQKEHHNLVEKSTKGNGESG